VSKINLAIRFGTLDSTVNGIASAIYTLSEFSTKQCSFLTNSQGHS